MPALRSAIAAGKQSNRQARHGQPAEADELAELLKDYKGVAQVAMQNRFLPAVLKARRLIEEGFLGPVTHFRAAHLHGGSVDPDKPVDWKSTAAAGGESSAT